MEITRSFKKVPRLLAAAAVMSTLTVGAIALSSSPAFATGGPLANMSMLVSNNAANVSGTGNSNVTYTWAFTTATAGPLTELDFTVPTDTVGTSLTATAPSGLGAGCTVPTAAMVALSGVVKVTLAGTCSAATATTAVTISVTGFTNTATAQSWPSVITTIDISTVDTGTAPAVNFADNTTGVTIVVPDSLTFTNVGPPNISLFPVPLTTSIAPPVELDVATNANSYKLSACSAALTGESPTIPAAGVNGAAPTVTPGTSAFGATAAVTGTLALNAGTWSSSNYTGYAPTCSSSGQSLIATGGPTNLDTLKLTNAATVEAKQTAGTYSGTIVYLVTPSY